MEYKVHEETNLCKFSEIYIYACAHTFLLNFILITFVLTDNLHAYGILNSNGNYFVNELGRTTA